MMRRTAPWRRFAGPMLATLALLGLVLATGTVLHAHVSPGQGFYNQEHDLTTLAGVGSAAATPDVPSVAPLVDVAVALVLAPPLLGRTARRRPDCRAPPTV